MYAVVDELGRAFEKQLEKGQYKLSPLSSGPPKLALQPWLERVIVEGLNQWRRTL